MEALVRHSLLFAALLLGCTDPVVESVPDVEEHPDAEVVALFVEALVEEPEVVEEDPPDETVHAAGIPVSQILRGRRTVNSPRLLTRRVTEVQRAPSRHEERVTRWGAEVRNIGDDEVLLRVTVLVLARMAFSEANWENREDMRALYQVLRTTRGNTETLINAMRNHSRVVSEVWAPRRARERWIAGLNLDLVEPTARWGRVTEEGAWEQTYRAKWETLLGWASDLVHGRDRTRQCPVPVVAWGGRCDVASGACDDAIARWRGLIPVETCGATANRYWARTRHFTPETARREVLLSLRRGRDPEPTLVELFGLDLDVLQQLVDASRAEEGQAETEVGLESLRELPEAVAPRAGDVSSADATRG